MLLGGDTATGTAFGFQVPQGSPAELDAAASACSRWAGGLSARAGAVRSGAATAMVGWSGSAEGNFAALASHVQSIYGTLGETVGSAGKTLSTFAQELETAQRVTQQALQECETYHQQMVSAQQEAAGHAQTVQDLSTRTASAVHPAEQALLSRQLTAAEDAQTTAQRAASTAQGEFEAAQQRGVHAWQSYEHQAQGAAQTLQGLAGEVDKATSIPGASGAPGTQGGFFWPTLGGVIGSTELDSTIGLAEGIMSRYRNTDLVLPITQAANDDLAAFAAGAADNGDLYTMAGSLWVPKGSSADPLVQEIQLATSGEEWTQPGKPTFVINPDDLEAAAPQWASGLSKGLGYGAVALTFYSTGAEQWEYDDAHHPNWSTTQKALDVAQTTAVVGGSQAGGAWVGAETGAESGAAIGEMIDPLGGGVVGGIVGGVVGGVAGGEVGQAIGHGAETVGRDIGHVASGLWNDVFG